MTGCGIAEEYIKNAVLAFLEGFSPEECVKSAVGFLMHIFRPYTMDFGRILKTNEIILNVISESISQKIKADITTLEVFRAHYKFNRNNILFNSFLVYKLRESGCHGPADKISDEYYSEFIKLCETPEHVPDFGFAYDYQRSYFNGLLYLISHGNEEKQKTIYDDMLGNISEMTKQLKNPFLRQRAVSYNYFMNMKYLANVFLRLIHTNRIRMTKNETDTLFSFLDAFLPELDAVESTKNFEYYLWDTISVLALNNEDFKMYSIKKVKTFDYTVPFFANWDDIPDEIEKVARKGMDFVLDQIDDAKILFLYWLFYARRSSEYFLERCFERLSDGIRKEIADAHKIRSFENAELAEVLTAFEKIIRGRHSSFYTSKFLDYWIYRFGLNDIQEAKEIAEVLREITV